MAFRSVVYAAALALPLSGCGSYGPPPPHEDGFGAACNADSVQDAIGKPFSQVLLEDTRSRAGARIARPLRPGQAVTMEFNPTRVNLILDSNDIVQAVRCG